MNQSAAHRIARQTDLAVREARVVGSQHGYQHLMIALAGGQRAFAKVAPVQEAAPAEMGAAFAAEASGLRWLAERDLILAMDARNLADLRRMAKGQDAERIRLFSEVSGLTETRDIPDPWGGGPEEFGHVLDLLGAAAPVIAERLARLLKTSAE